MSSNTVAIGLKLFTPLSKLKEDSPGLKVTLESDLLASVNNSRFTYPVPGTTIMLVNPSYAYTSNISEDMTYIAVFRSLYNHQNVVDLFDFKGNLVYSDYDINEDIADPNDKRNDFLKKTLTRMSVVEDIKDIKGYESHKFWLSVN